MEMRVGGWRREDLELSRSALIAGQPSFSGIRGSVARAGMGEASDLRRFSPPKRHDQLNTQSCVANAVTRALEIKRILRVHGDLISAGVGDSAAIDKAQSSHVPLSRSALYFLARESMSPPETDKDEGTIISLAAEVLTRFGLSREERDPTDPSDRAFWPFDPSRTFVSPPWMAMREAYIHKTAAWHRIDSRGDQRISDVIMNLSAGNPVVFGTTVDSSWMDYSDGILGPVKGTILGRHATVLVGWDPSGYFWDEGSWSDGWGINGFGKVSPEVISGSDSDDFLVLTGGWESWS